MNMRYVVLALHRCRDGVAEETWTLAGARRQWRTPVRLSWKYARFGCVAGSHLVPR